MAETRAERNERRRRARPALDLLTDAQLRGVVDAGQMVVSTLDLDTILERLLEVARELTGATYAALGVLDKSHDSLEQFRTQGIDEQTRERIGDLPTGRGVLGTLIREPEPLRLADVSKHPDSIGFPAEHPPMTSFLGVPVVIAGSAWGNLYLTDKESGEFDEADEALATVLAAWAAIAVQNSRSLDRQVVREAAISRERERARWSRELHDETLQQLGALRVLLSGALRRNDPNGLRSTAQEVVESLQGEIANLRRLVTELRPAAVDDLGFVTAIEALGERLEQANGVEVATEIDPALELLPGDSAEIALVTAYRIIQEALTNVGKHAGARNVGVRVSATESDLALEVADDGSGFDQAKVTWGLGIVGLRERATLAGGGVEIKSIPGQGTRVRATIPL